MYSSKSQCGCRILREQKLTNFGTRRWWKQTPLTNEKRERWINFQAFKLPRFIYLLPKVTLRYGRQIVVFLRGLSYYLMQRVERFLRQWRKASEKNYCNWSSQRAWQVAAKKTTPVLHFSPRLLGKALISLFILATYPERRDVDRRLRICIVTMGIGAIAIGVVFRLYTIQDTEYEKWEKIAGRQHSTSITIQGVRGAIKDSQDRVLAVSVQAASVGAHPRQLRKDPQTIKNLSSILEIPESKIKNIINQEKSFVWLARALPKETADRIDSLKLKGVVSIPEFRRYYPHGELAGALIGRVNRDGQGQSGVEGYFDKMLSAKARSISVSRDARGRLVTDLNEKMRNLGTFRESLNRVSFKNKLIPDAFASTTSRDVRSEGKDVSLSIDSYIQNIVEEELHRGLVDAQAKHIIGVLMDAQTGELISIAQSPGFNPNQQKNLDPETLKNFVLQDNFEPGSTFKPIVAAIALEQKLTRVDEQIDCEMGRYQVGKYTIKDVHPSGVLSVRDVLVRSSNICMTKLGQRLGKERLGRALIDFGFSKQVGIELAGEGKGIMREPNTWANIDVATHSFGQGISVTALQMAQAYSSFINNGVMVRPTILKVKPEEVRGERVLAEETAKTIFEVLTGVTEDSHGTAKGARIMGVRVSGKTGTAQKPNIGARGYDSNRVLASFIGMIDAREIGIEKKLIMFVAVDEPGVFPRYGGTVAAPVFRRAMERILSHLMSGSHGLSSNSSSVEKEKEEI
ncbi:MAG: penicillin-binding protein 2 [Deltaproteobacteria bacterium]|nr:penicillin-binding protein 2 [Deltaproteobacteria bacterium]